VVTLNRAVAVAKVPAHIRMHLDRLLKNSAPRS